MFLFVSKVPYEKMSHDRLSGDKIERKSSHERSEKMSRLSDDKMSIERLHEEKIERYSI